MLICQQVCFPITFIKYISAFNKEKKTTVYFVNYFHANNMIYNLKGAINTKEKNILHIYIWKCILLIRINCLKFHLKMLIDYNIRKYFYLLSKKKNSFLFSFLKYITGLTFSKDCYQFFFFFFSSDFCRWTCLSLWLSGIRKENFQEWLAGNIGK